MATNADTPYSSSTDSALRDDGSNAGSSTTGSTATSTTGSSAMYGRGDYAGEGDVMGRVVQGAHDTIDRLAERLAPHVYRLQEGVSTASSELNSRAGHAREVSDEWAESLRTTVRENPLAALATAAAVGMLVARLTR